MACRTARPKRELIRIVRTADRDVVIDRSGRLNGRGAYVCDMHCLDIAIHKGALARALETTLPPTFPETVAADATRTDIDTQGGARGQE